MRQTTTILLLLATASLCAQVKLPDFPNTPRVLGTEDLAINSEPAYTPATVSPRLSVRKAKEGNVAGYLPPVGTLFLGMDMQGEGVWFNGVNGVIGAWSDSIPCWKWTNNVKGDYKKISYTNRNLTTYPSALEEGYYGKDAQNNFYDSIASSGWDQAYKADEKGMDQYGDADKAWLRAIPLQTVTWSDGTEENYMFLSNMPEPKVKEAGIAVGGLPSSKTSDGLWPLTLAIGKTIDGISMEYLDQKDKSGYTHYLFGTDSLTTDTTGGVYKRTAPKRIVVSYDRPQAPLYVKSISIMVSAMDFTLFTPNINVDNLRLSVITSNGDTIARSVATQKSLSYLKYKSGQMLNFTFVEKDKYGIITKEGFTVGDPFTVEIDALTSKHNFGIYAAKCSILESGAWVEYENGTKKQIDYEPYVMLNGLFTTLECYASRKIYESYDTGVHGDTVDINMVSVNNNPNYKYQAHYAGKDLANGTTFEYYASYIPYDSITRTWLMDISAPDYIILGADCDYNYGTAERPFTIWSYAHCFDMYIYATKTPKIGDEIKMAKAGREAVFRIVAIDGATSVNEIIAESEKKSSQKVLGHDGVVRILRGNNQYTILGQKID